MIQAEAYFLLRTPLLPYSRADYFQGASLKTLFSDPLLQEALFLASPVLYNRLAPWMADELSSEESRRISLSLHKYLVRLYSRPTPFGLFGGISRGYWSSQTSAQLSEKIHRVTRLDTDYVSLLVERLLHTPEVGQRVRFFPNNTLYAVGDKLHYVECRYEEGKRTYHLSAVDNNEHITTVLTKARWGVTKSILAQSIAMNGISEEEAHVFVEELIQNQLLVSELETRLTGTDYFSYVHTVLKTYNLPIAMILGDVDRYLKSFDKQSPSENLQRYPVFIRTLKKLLDVDGSDNFIQVDYKKSGAVTIHKQVGAAIEKVVELLSRVLPPRENTVMENFRKAFAERYEFKTVDLCIALDPETGIGYPLTYADHNTESLLSKICFPGENEVPTIELTAFQNFLLKKFTYALQHHSDVVLREIELLPFVKPSTLPSSLYAFVSLYASDAAAMDTGDFTIQFNGAAGPSAATLMARFCHLDEELTELIRDTLHREEQQQPDAVFAEIVHVNQARIGNISTRPVLRGYEIPILAVSGVDDEHTIPLSDLTIALRGTRFILWSKKLNKKVIPRLSSAHNYRYDTIPAYRFLCDLQFEGVPGSLRWDWGILKSAPYLPKVSLGNVVLSSACWRLSEQEILSIRNAASVKEEVAALRKHRQIPQVVLIGEGDNKISIDLENEDHLSIFQKILESASVLEECLFTKHNLFITDKEGQGYTNELIIPLTSKQEVHEATILPPRHKVDVLRNFALGSEWLYFKIYCAAKSADHVLMEIVKPLVEDLLHEKVIDKWFFLRYADPANHIRLRLHGHGSFYNEVIARLHQRIDGYIETGLVSGLVTDVYRRELERYGAENIADTESLFFVDSDYTIRLLSLLGDDDNLRWQMALLGADQLLSAFDVPLLQKKAMAGDLQQHFFKEMNADPELKRSLATVLRNNRKTINGLLSGTRLDAPAQSIVKEREERLAPIAANIVKRSQAGTLSTPLPGLLKSYLHMSFNRLFPSNPRRYEMVLYDFMFQIYHSELVRRSSSHPLPRKPLS